MRWVPVALLVAVLSSGCINTVSPERVVPVSNKGYQVDQLFTDQRGCTIYRFYDMGDYRYYVVGPDGAHMLPTTHVIEDTSDDPIVVDSGGCRGHHGGGHGRH